MSYRTNLIQPKLAQVAVGFRVIKLWLPFMDAWIIFIPQKQRSNLYSYLTEFVMNVRCDTFAHVEYYSKLKRQ